MSEGTEKFIILGLDNATTSSWAADDSDPELDRGSKDVKPVKAAWGNAAFQTSKTPDLTTIFAEETKKAEEEKLKAPIKSGVYKPPRGPGTREIRPFNGTQERQEPRPQRELPTEPPFTAFVGNLSFEVTAEMLGLYFGDLGIVSIKIMEENGSPRGYAYIEFHDQSGLEKALSAGGLDFCGRKLNMDVAKPSRSKERYDNSWGPSANKVQYSNRSSFNNRGPPGGSNYNNRPPQQERRPQNVYASQKTPSAQATDLHDTISKPKGSFENPFGNAAMDHKKMDELAQQRLKNELEREKREKDKKDEQFRNRRPPPPEQQQQPPPQYESKTASSWRTNKPPGSLPPRREEPSKPAHPRKQLIQGEDGFFTKGYRNSNREVREAPQTHEQQPPVEPRPTTTYPKSKKNNEKIDDSNIFASLTELND